MLNKLTILLVLLSTAAFGAASREKAQGYCEQGGQTVVVNASVTSTGKTMKSYPGCTVTIYTVGTTNLAIIYADDNNTPKANPFTADATTGAWFFYADDGEYDVRTSNAGISPAFTRGDWQLFDRNYLLAGSGAVSRRVKDKLSDWLSVRDFGAVGDGIVDDTAAIQAALNYASTNRKVLYIPGSGAHPACYKTTATLIVPGNTTLTGFGDNEAVICYSGNTANDIIKIGDGVTFTYRVFLTGFRVETDTGAANAIHLSLASEGGINIRISGTSLSPSALVNGIYCDMCFLYEFVPTISWVGTAMWFNSTGVYGQGLNYIHDGNIFENQTSFKISWGVGMHFDSNQVENFTTAVNFDNDCGIPGTGCLHENITFQKNLISVFQATNHDSPVGVKTTLTTSKANGVRQFDFSNNVIVVVKNGGGTAPYVFNFDLLADPNSYVYMTANNNNIEGGTTSSIYATGSVVTWSDQGGNNYRLDHNGDDRPNSEIFSGTLNFNRWDYRQYYINSQLSGRNTLVTIQPNTGQFGVTSPVLTINGVDKNPDIDYANAFGWIFRADTAFTWVKKYGFRDPADNTVYGFSGIGAPNAFSYLFTGSDRLHPWQTWYKATGNTSIGDTITDNGTKLQVKGSVSLTGGYGPTTNLANVALLQLGAAGVGANVISAAWGDGTGYRWNFGPVLAGTFTPKAYIEDTGNLGGRMLVSSGVVFGSLGAPANGVVVWCPDCTIGAGCTGGGTGAFAFRSVGAWKCPF